MESYRAVWRKAYNRRLLSTSSGVWAKNSVFTAKGPENLNLSAGIGSHGRTNEHG